LRWLRFNEVVVINISKISTISSSLPFNQYVKRVTGLPQTAVKIHLSDLHELVQTSLREKCNHEGYLIWEIPPRHFFVRGDAKLSNDSLIWGALPSSALVGVMVTKLPKQATHISSDNKKQIFPS
jgi:hypothetical protein